MKTIKNYEDAIFNIAKDLNKSYPSFMEDLGVEHKEVDKEKVIHTISKYSDLKIEDNATLTMINSNNESISYQELERAIYRMVYHQICNLNM